MSKLIPKRAVFFAPSKNFGANNAQLKCNCKVVLLTTNLSAECVLWFSKHTFCRFDDHGVVAQFFQKLLGGFMGLLAHAYKRRAYGKAVKIQQFLRCFAHCGLGLVRCVQPDRSVGTFGKRDPLGSPGSLQSSNGVLRFKSKV